MSPKIFTVKPDENYPHKYDLDASHRWALPGVKCDVCGWTGITLNIAYPDVNLPEDLDPVPYQDHWPVTPQRLQELIRPLRPLIRSDLPIGAGMRFGRIEGRGEGRFGAFTWLNYSTPLISPGALDKLGSLRLSAVPTEIILRGNRRFDYLELVAEPHAALDPQYLPPGSLESCPRCGISKMHHTRSGWDENPVILAKSIPSGSNLMRVKELEGTLLATEAFVNLVRKHRLTGIAFEETRLDR